MKKYFRFSRRDFLFTSFGSAIAVFLTRITGKSSDPQEIQTQEDLSSLGTSSQTTPWRSLVDDPNKLIPGTRFDILIIGSGYGASTLAARLSEQHGTNKSICLLERGKEWLPGDFPHSASQVVNAMRTPINPQGLLDTNSTLFGDMDVVSANGLGGTSLLNAAIALPPKVGVLSRAPWPKEIQEEAQDGRITVYYQRARQILKPRTDVNFASYQKVKSHTKVIREEGHNAIPLTLNINYDLTTKNDYGTPQGACVACGDCCSGCNKGAKNTLQMNYLSIAKNNGVQIHTLVEVKHVEEMNDGSYKITCINRNPKKAFLTLPRLFPASDDLVLYANKVIIGAGSRGSTELLQRSDQKGLSISEALGTRASANGDVLGFGYNGDNVVHGFSEGPENLDQLPIKARVGQGIMIGGDYRSNSQTDLEKDFVFLEGSIPSSLASLVAKTLATTTRHLAKYSSAQTARMNADMNITKFPSPEGALGHSTLFLACGHDSSGGRYVLQKNGQAKVVWNDPLNEASIVNIKEQMRDVCHRQGSVFIENPWEHFLGRKTIVATHPLGGCPMGDDERTGVVNHKGQVFKKDGSLHQNLYVVDGSIIPTSLAAPPLLTITAMAERIAEKMREDARA